MKKLEYDVIFAINRGIEEMLDTKYVNVDWFPDYKNNSKIFKAKVNWACLGNVEPTEAEEFGKKILLATEVANELNKYEVKGISSDEYELDVEDKKKIVHMIKESGRLCMIEEVFEWVMNTYGQEA